MLARNVQAMLAVVLVTPLPWIATIPKVGEFIGRGARRFWICAAGLALGLLGLLAWGVGLVSLSIGMCFFAPLWQALVVIALYKIWFKFREHRPLDTTYNWNSGLFWDRAIAIVIMLAGILPFVFFIRPK